MVDSGGGSVTFSRTTASGRDYKDTLNVVLPSLKLVRQRVFSWSPLLFEQRLGRVLLGLDTRLLRWTPKTSAITTLSSGRWVGAADSTAGQQMRQANDGSYAKTVGPIPPRTGASWAVGVDTNISTWSPDDQLIATTGEVISGRTQTGIIVRRAATGSSALVVLESAQARVTRENSSTVLFNSFHEGTEEQGWESRFQLIRCTLAGECQRIGPETENAYSGYLVATRRSN